MNREERAREVACAQIHEDAGFDVKDLRYTRADVGGRWVRVEVFVQDVDIDGPQFDELLLDPDEVAQAAR